MPSKKPDSFLGWLGRQVGFVNKAIKTDVAKKPEPPQQKPSPVETEPTVIYRNGAVQESTHPQDPNLTLRRTTIDEVVRQPPAGAGGDAERANAPDPSDPRP